MKDETSIPSELQHPSHGLCAHANLRQATRVLSQLYDAALKPSGVKATQFTILAVLEARGQLPLTRLAESLVMDRTTLTRNLQPLVKKGWLAIEREQDERVRLVSLTGSGRAVLSDATPLWREVQSRIVHETGAEKLTTLISDLNSLVQATRAD
ncbi:MAG: MarR family winged helix-turn-helix transcriptional regulator [Pseudomonadota bacterium]